MNDTVSFLHADVVWPLGIGAILLWVLFLWKEWGLPKRQFYGHALIAAIAITSLTLLILRPMMVDVRPENRGVLLTENFSRKQLDSLKKEHPRLVRIPYEENRSFGETLDSLSSVFILGNGLRPYDFWQLENTNTTYIPSALPNGLIRLNYNREAYVGRPWKVQGRYNAQEHRHRLVLMDPGGRAIDSVAVDTLGIFDFELKADLQFKGKSLFYLLEKDAAGIEVSKEPLPIKVVPVQKLRLLLIQQFPTFDAKYLKNFLAETGNELIVRNQLSKGKYKFEYFNTARRPFNSVSKKFMADMDLLLIDADSYAKLSRGTRRIINEAVRNEGLGLLILPDDGLFRLPSSTTPFEFTPEKTPQVAWEHGPKLLLEKYPFRFRAMTGLEEIHRSEGLTLAAYTRKGKGRIGTTIVRNSFQWVLNGSPEAYGDFWAGIISAMGKRSEMGPLGQAIEFFAYRDEPFPFVLRTTMEHPEVYGGNGSIPLAQGIDMEDHYTGITYPRKTGWNALYSAKDSLPILDFYVMDSSSWKSVRAFKTRYENQRKFNGSSVAYVHRKFSRPISPLWFFFVTLLGLGYLWIAPKLTSH